MTATLLEAPALRLRGVGLCLPPGEGDLLLEAIEAHAAGRTRGFVAKHRSRVPWSYLRHTLGYVVALRNLQLDGITTQISSNGLLRIYDGSRPATGGAATTLLAELALSATAAPGASSGVLTFSTITNDSSADATGTATWHRFATSGGTAKIDGSTGTSGTDLVFNTAAFVTGAVIAVTSYTITAGNA